MSDWYAKNTFAGLLADAAKRWERREALCHEGRRHTFGELKAEVDRVAKGLMKLGINRGDRVTLWMPNRPEWIFAFLALSKIGAITVPMNTRFRALDFEYGVRQSEASVVIAVDRSGPVDFLALIAEAIPEVRTQSVGALDCKKFPDLRNVLILGNEVPKGALDWHAVLRAGETVTDSELEHRSDEVDPDATTLMLYTSGTTGFPKGVMHSHSIQRNVVDIANRLGYRTDDVTLMNWPLFHIVGLYLGPLLMLTCGTRCVLTTTFDPVELLALIAKERVTRIWGFDTQLAALSNHPDRERTDLSSLRTGLGAVGMVSSEAVAQRAQALLCPTVSGWGMTEIGAGVTVGYPDGAREDAWMTSGYPLPGLEFKVIDLASGLEVPHGELGELCARGYSVTRGYYKKLDETAKAIDADGWLHTGDVASMRADGAIRFLGRYKDLLKVGGENVDPAEVEGFLLTHPGIAQVQIVGVPDQRLTEVACACVVAKPGHTIDTAALDAFCRGKLASFKIPRYALCLDEFPMTASGKPQKFKLRELAATKFGQS